MILLPPQRDGYPISYLKKVVGSNSTIYIRTIQLDLPFDLKDLIAALTVSFEFNTCGIILGFAQLSAHQLVWQKEHGQMDDDILEAQPGPSTAIETNSLTKEITTLKDMFPIVKEAFIDDVLTSSFLLNEAANALSDKSAIVNDGEVENNKLGKRNSKVIKCNSIAEALKCFQREIDISEDGKLELKIDRNNIWFESLKFYQRYLNNCEFMKRNFVIDFDNEEVLDGGAIKIEHFTLLLKEIKSRLFVGGKENSLFPIRDIKKSSFFKIAGMVMVHSIISGNPEGFPVIAEAIYLSICNFKQTVVMSKLDSDQIPRNSSTKHLLDLMHGLMECNKDGDIDNLLYNDDPKSEIFWILINCTN